MKRTIRERVNAPYTLHDRNIVAFDIVQEETLDTLILRIQPGIKKCVMEYVQENGYVEFQKVDWDFSSAYVINTTENEGKFTGEKFFLKDFIAQFGNSNLEIIDENYGAYQTKYSGWLSRGDLRKEAWKECIIEIVHLGDMVFVTEEE